MSNEEQVGTVDVVGSTASEIRVLIEAELLRETPANFKYFQQASADPIFTGASTLKPLAQKRVYFF